MVIVRVHRDEAGLVAAPADISVRALPRATCHLTVSRFEQTVLTSAFQGLVLTMAKDEVVFVAAAGDVRVR
jgi:hypothetical protein